MKFLSIAALLLAVCLNLRGERIVTLAPALTEMVFALGKGDRIVGITKFCNYPEETKKIPRIGGFLDVNLELLIRQKPDVIIYYQELHEKLNVMKNKSQLVIVKHSNLDDIFNGISTVAKTLGIETKGKALNSRIKEQLDNIRQKNRDGKKPKTLLVIGRNADNLSAMYIIGAKDFLNELLQIAGGVNAYPGNMEYPSISIESIITMNPDVIIELSAFNEGIDDRVVLDSWNKFPFLTAVKKKKIAIIKDSMWLIPGPRVAEIARKMQQILSPHGGVL